MQAGRVLDDGRLREVAERLTGVAGVVGVALGGSRARGAAVPESDVDLGLYYRPPLDTVGLARLAQRITGSAVDVTEPGAWGPWVDGGAWLTVDGTAVDWIYRDLDRVQASREAAQAGRFTFHAQVGHPLGVLDTAYAGELALGVVLADPSGELTALQQRVAAHPPALGRALVERLWEARFSVDNAGKAVSRADTAYVAGCLFRAVELCALALHGRAGRWWVGEKGAVAAAGQLPGAPEDFTRRAHDVLAQLGGSAASLGSAVTAAAQLVDDVVDACAEP